MNSLVGLNLVANEALLSGDVERLRLCLQESLNPEMTLRCIYATKEYGLLETAVTGVKSILNNNCVQPELKHKIYLDLLLRGRTKDCNLLESSIDKIQLYKLMVENGVNIFSLSTFGYTSTDLRIYFKFVLTSDAYELFVTMEDCILLTLREKKVLEILVEASLRKCEGHEGKIIKHLVKKGKGELFASYCLKMIRCSVNRCVYFPLLRAVCSLCSCPKTIADAFASMKSFSQKVFYDLVVAFASPLTEEQKEEWKQYSPQYYVKYFHEEV